MHVIFPCISPYDIACIFTNCCLCYATALHACVEPAEMGLTAVITAPYDCTEILRRTAALIA